MTTDRLAKTDPRAITFWSLSLAACLTFWGLVGWGVVRVVGWVS